MVARREIELGHGADLAQQLVLGAGRRGRIRQVRQRRKRRLQARFDLAQLLLELLGTRSHLAHRSDLPLALACVGGRPDAPIGLVLLRAQPLELRQQLASPRVERDHGVETIGGAPTAPSERRANTVGILANQLEIEHVRSLSVCDSAIGNRDLGSRHALSPRPSAKQVVRSARPSREASRSGRVHDLRHLVDSVMFVLGTFSAFNPEYLARNRATSWASSPTTTFSGMIAPEKPPLRIA